jgi:hypothetical protein
LACSIELTGTGGAVTAKLENHGPGDVSGEFSTLFILAPPGSPAEESLPGGSDSYWAPVDLASRAHYFGPSQIPELSLSKGEHLTMVVQLRYLLWAKRISSVWPDRFVWNVVPPGEYGLHLEVAGPTIPEGADSNRILVRVGNGSITTVPQ